MRQKNKNFESELDSLKKKYFCLDEINQISSDKTKFCILTIIDNFSNGKREKIPAKEVKGIINTIYRQYNIKEKNTSDTINETEAYKLFFDISSVTQQSNSEYSLKPSIREKIEKNISKEKDYENSQLKPLRSPLYIDIFDEVKKEINKSEEKKITLKKYKRIVEEQLKKYRKKYHNSYYQTNRNVKKSLSRFLKIGGEYVELKNSDDKINQNSLIKNKMKKKGFLEGEKEYIQNGNGFYKRRRSSRINGTPPFYREYDSSDIDSGTSKKIDSGQNKEKNGIKYRNSLKDPILFREGARRKRNHGDGEVVKVVELKNKARKFVFFERLEELKNEELENDKINSSNDSYIRKYIKERYKLKC